MNNKIPDEEKKVKISISVDPFLDKKIAEMAINKKFYKKSRLIEFILKKYMYIYNDFICNDPLKFLYKQLGLGLE